MEIRIYFEGNPLLKDGFNKFFSALHNAARSHSTVRLIAAKNGVTGYAKGCRANPDAINILLKDSEGPLDPNQAAQCHKLGIHTPHPDRVFWMVVQMESWFLADPAALAKYYRFSAGTLPETQDVEKIPKADVMPRLKQATKNTTKGEYHKVAHAPGLLKELDPAIVQNRARNCKKLFDAVLSELKNPP